MPNMGGAVEGSGGAPNNPTLVPPPNMDPRLLVHIVKVVVEGMTTSTTQTVPAIQVPQTTTRIIPTTDSMVLLVRSVRSI